MSKLIDFNSIRELDYKKLGLKCGIEIHQQLNTGKLFCGCPCEIVPNESLDKSIMRKLRFSSGESGQIDKAAMKEFEKGKYNIYRYNDKIACLVDLDEEPPHKINELALKTALKTAKMLNINLFDRVQFMRKLIIDGSVTGGFQRTAMLGLNGYLDTNEGKVLIDGVNIEEDSCRVLERNNDHSIFSLDRQGIPLIEITTGPQIYSPKQAQETAKQIGNILRSFKETKRGLGTIRQDLNVSIIGGSRIEIKGAQNLRLIPQIVENEVKRQMIHISILEEIKLRKINKDNFSDFKIYDLSEIFKECDSKIINNNLQEKNSKVLGIKLFSLKGILGLNMQENYRFASEISDRNKSQFPSIKGLFHSDELPKYGIEEKEVLKIRENLRLTENDAFIILAGNEKLIEKSLKNILEIIAELFKEVPSEVRQIIDNKEVKTKFLRHMPGSARMYPETDIPQIILEKKYLEDVYEKIPEIYDKKIKRLEKEFNLSENKIEEILEDFEEEEIKKLINISSKKANFLYEILYEIPKDIKKRENIESLNFKLSLLEDLLYLSEKNNFNQKIIREIFLSLYKDNLEEVSNLEKYLKEKNLIKDEISEGELEKEIIKTIEENAGAPFSAIMGILMKKYNNLANGKKISEILKKHIK